MGNLNAGALRYIRFVLANCGMSASALAKEAGIAATTLTRFLNSPDYKYTISTTTIEKIASASGINPAPFFESKTAADLAKLAYFNTKGVYDSSWPVEEDMNISTTIVIGEVAAGQWREVELADIYKMPPLAVDLSFYDNKNCFAVIVRGESINRIAKDGDYLLCTRMDARSIDLTRDNFVVIQRQREDGMMVELTARRLRQNGDDWEAHFESTDERYQKPLMVPFLADTDEITFVGIVRFIVRIP